MDNISPGTANDEELMVEPKLLANRYRVEREIGHGPMATVYQAIDLRDDQQVAVKIFQARFRSDPAFAIHFREHLKVLTGIRQENLVAILDYGFSGEEYYLITEWCAGTSLRTELAERGALLPAEAVFIAEQICAAVEALHRQGLVHRGLKPENILLTTDGQVKVADAGLSGLISETGLSKTNVLLNGVGYISPEQARGDTINPQVDIYNIGLLIFEMLAGRLPFESPDTWTVVKMHAEAQAPALQELAPAVLADLSDIVARALRKEGQDRFASPAEMEVALAQLPSSEGATLFRVPFLNRPTEAFGFSPLLENIRDEIRGRSRQLVISLNAIIKRKPLSRRLLAAQYFVSFFVAFILLLALTGPAPDNTAAAAGPDSEAQYHASLPSELALRNLPSGYQPLSNAPVPYAIIPVLGTLDDALVGNDSSSSGAANSSSQASPSSNNGRGQEKDEGKGKAKGKNKDNGKGNNGKGKGRGNGGKNK